MSLTVLPIKIGKKENEFELFDIIIEAFEKNRFSIKEGDVISNF